MVAPKAPALINAVWVDKNAAAGMLDMNVTTFDKSVRFEPEFLRTGAEMKNGKFSVAGILEYDQIMRDNARRNHKYERT